MGALFMAFTSGSCHSVCSIADAAHETVKAAISKEVLAKFIIRRNMFIVTKLDRIFRKTIISLQFDSFFSDL